MAFDAMGDTLRTRGPAQSAAFAVLLAASIAAATFFQVDGGSSPWYPAAGIALAWLILGSWRVAPLVLVVGVGTDFLVTDGVRDQPFGLPLTQTALAVLGYTVVAVALDHLELERLDLRALGWFATLGVIVAPGWSALSAGLAQSWFTNGTPVLSEDSLTLFVGDAIGVITFTPLLLFLSGVPATPDVPHEVRPDTTGLEALLGAMALVAVPFLAAFGEGDGLFFPLLVAVIVPIVWVALRLEPVGVAMGVCLSTTAVSIAARIAPGVDADALIQVQTLMLTSALVAAFVTTAHYGALRRMAALLAARDRLAWSTTHDHRTGMLNRVGLVQQTTSIDGTPGTVVIFDTGAGSDANEALGRQVTDEMASQCADRRRSALPAASPLALIDNGLLASILPPDPVSVHAIIGRCTLALSPPLDVEGVMIHPELSLGIASRGAVGDDAVDQAMFALRESRRRSGKPVRFDKEMSARSVAASARLGDLRRALAEGEVTAYFQPIVRVDDGLIVGAEALARWRHPTRGIVVAGDFVPTAERAGLIAAVGHAARVEVMRLAVELLPKIPGRSFTFSLNTSALEIEDDLIGELIELTNAYAVDPARLVIEVTETAALPDRSRAVSLLGSLREAGMGVSIDDVGTGHSSLSQMTRLPVTELKIDGSFVQGLPGIRDEAVVRTITSLAAELGLDLVAEGVETEEQLAILRSCGVPKVQGFLTGRPMTAQALVAVLVSPPGPGETSSHGGVALRPRPGD